MPLPAAITRIGDWTLRTAALRQAREQVGSPTESYRRAVDQVKVLVEVARRVAEPVEALPRGSRPAVLLSLYRDAVYWALLAERIRRGDVAAAAATDLGAVWASTDPALLQKAAGGEARLTAMHGLLLDRPTAASLNSTDEEVASARSLAENLLWELDAPARTVERLQVQRWTRVAAATIVVLGLVFGLRAALRGPNLVASRNFKTSSAYADCTLPNKCADIFFHTQPQDNPWIDFDLGAVKTVSYIEVRNRTDCCSERAVPLVVETSLDDKTWVQAARRDAEFSTDWSTKFPKQKARYVRLRVPRSTTLHFEDVIVR